MTIYRQDKQTGKLVETTNGPTCAEAKTSSGDGWRYGDRLYSAKPWRAHDGTLIDSRKKHRDYMKRHDLTTADDYAGAWKQAEQMREKAMTGEHDKAARAEAIKRAIEKVGK